MIAFSKCFSFALSISSIIFVPKSICQIFYCSNQFIMFLYIFCFDDYISLLNHELTSILLPTVIKMCLIISTFNNFQVTFASNIHDINNKNKPLIFPEINKHFMPDKGLICFTVRYCRLSNFCTYYKLILKAFTRNTNLFSMHQVFCQWHFFFLGWSPSWTSLLLLLPQGAHSVASVHRTLRALQITGHHEIPLPLSYFLDLLFLSLSLSSLNFLIWHHRVLVEAQGIFSCGMMGSNSLTRD